MKNIASILVVVFAFTFTAQAQRPNRAQMGSNLTPEQRTTLAVKKMALQLDLTKDQMKKVSDLYAVKGKERAAMVQKIMKERAGTRTELAKIKTESKDQADFKRRVASAVKDGKIQKGSMQRMRPVADFESQNKALDAQLDFQNKMQKILTPVQYEKFKKMRNGKMKMAKNKMTKNRMAKNKMANQKRPGRSR